MKRLLMGLILSLFSIYSFAEDISSYEQDSCLESIRGSFEHSGVTLEYCNTVKTPLILNIDKERSVLVVKRSSQNIGFILCTGLGHKEFVELELGARVTCNEESLCSEFDVDGVLTPRVSAKVSYSDTIDPLGYYRHEEKNNAIGKFVSTVRESMVREGRYKGGRFIVHRLTCKD